MNAMKIMRAFINPNPARVINFSSRSINNLPQNLQEKIIDCKGLSKMMKKDFKKKIPIIQKNFSLQNKPKLKIISVGDKIDNKIYIDNKIKACEFIGINYEHKSFPSSTKLTTIENEILKSNKDEEVNGIIVQLPLSKELNPYSSELLNQISLEKHVDGINENILNNFMKYNQLELDEILFNPTALGVMELIRLCFLYENNVKSFKENHWRYCSFYEKPMDLKGKNICLLGKGKTAGHPISLIVEKGNCNLNICDINTPKEKFEKSLRESDIIISAVGKINLVKRNLIKENCVIIDVGINEIPNQEKRRICGDVDFFECIEKVKYISTVPNGVGKMTVIMLLRNVIIAWLTQNNIKGKQADLLFVNDI